MTTTSILANLTSAAGTIDPSDITLRFVNRFGREIQYYDDGIGCLWLYRDAGGLMGIVRAQNESSAYEIVQDEFLTVVPAEELHDAYGAFDKLVELMEKKGHENTRQLRDFCTRWDRFYFDVDTKDANFTGAWDRWELVEGYAYQSNATGTGVVSHDLNGESLKPLTIEEIARQELQVEITFNA